MLPEDNNTKPQASKKAKLKKSKKRQWRTVIIIVASVLVLAVIGFATWFLAYMNSDEKILSDALNKTLSSQNAAISGEIKIISKDKAQRASIAVDFKGNVAENAQNLDANLTIKSGHESVTINADMLHAESGDLYIKVKDLRNILSRLGVDESDIAGVNIDNVSGRWIRISKQSMDDLFDSSENDDVTTCVNGAMNKIKNDSSMTKQLTSSIIDSNYVAANRIGTEKVNDKSAIKYELQLNPANQNDFQHDVENTDAYQLLNKCFDDADSNDVSSAAGSLDGVDVSAYIWVDKASHEPVKFNIRMADEDVSLSVSMNINLNKADTPSEPSDYVDVGDLEEALTSFSSSNAFLQLN